MKSVFNALGKFLDGGEGAQDQNRGVIDPDKLIAAADRIQKMIADENNAHQDRLKNLAASASRFQAETDKLLSAIAENERKDAGNAAQEQAEKSRIADFKRVSDIVTAISDGVQGTVFAPTTARFKKFGTSKAVAV